MRRLSKLFRAAGIVACLCFSVGLGHGWELELTGSFNWTYEFYSQQGNNGFFGAANVDNGGGTTAGNLNFWNGGQFDTNIVSGSTARWSYFNVEFEPTLKVNEAIRLKGKYRLGTYGNPLASDYLTMDAPGINNAFSEGQWTMFWATAQLPFGTVGIGKRPWTFATGLQYDGENSTTTESLSVVASYGPLDIGVAFYPYRFAGSSSIGAYGGFDPFDLPGFTTVGGAAVPGQYYSRADIGGSTAKDFLAFLNYHAGPMNMGLLGSFVSYHVGPEAVLQNPADPLPAAPAVALDSDLAHGSAYVKYNNGRFFLNAEGAWLLWTDRWSDPAGLAGAPNPRYTEQWRYMAEMGTVVGPTKISLLNAWSPGPDRRNGILIDKQ
ncbi:MAG: hypothetical protein V2B18_25430, partial [Pseudomonadota bacterium]